MCFTLMLKPSNARLYFWPQILASNVRIKFCRGKRLGNTEAEGMTVAGKGWKIEWYLNGVAR